MGKETVSILMPVYNASLYVESSIQAILNQTYTNLELLICDDCSTDNTFDILNKITDPRVKTFRNKVNKGYLLTCNFLAEKATGEFLTFQDADDLADINRIELLLDSLKKKSLDLVGSNVNYISQQGDIIGRSFYDLEISNSILLNEPLPFCGSSVLCKRDVYDAIGLYDEAFNRIGAEDYDWIYRASLQFKIGNVEEPLYSYRMHAESVSNLTSLSISTQLFSEHIARKLFEANINQTLNCSIAEFIREQKKVWEHYLEQDETPPLLKRATINSLSGKRHLNIKIIIQLLKCKGTLKIRTRAISLLTLDLFLGYENVFKLKTFYKKYIFRTASNVR